MPGSVAPSIETRPAAGRWSAPLWLALLVCLGGLALLSSQPLEDADTYMHIASGQWILQHAAVPAVDPFSHTMPGAPWVAHEWLAQVLMAWLQRHLGWTGLVLMALLGFALALACVLRFLLDRVPPVYALLFTMLTAATIATHMLARPHVLSWPLLAVWLGSLVRASEERAAPPWWLLGLMVPWANLHGSFVLGLALLPPLALDAVLHRPAGERWRTARRWGLFALLALAASLLTPHGWKGLGFILHVSQLKHLRTINEWMPASHWTTLLPLELWLVALLGLALSGLLRLPPLRLLLVLGLLHQAMNAGRYISIFGLLTPLLIATPFARWYAGTAAAQAPPSALDAFFERLRGRARPLAVLVAAAAIVLLAWAMRDTGQHGPDTAVQPVAAIEAAQRAGARGNVLNASHFGGHLIHRGIPVFIDGRADMYGDHLMGVYLDALVHGQPEVMQALLDDYRIGWTLLPPNSRMLVYLNTHPDWHKVYEDRIAVVHLRRSAP